MYKELALKYQNDIVEKTKELISIRSVEGEKDGDYPFGKPVADALKYVLDLADELGFKTVNYENYAGHIEMGDGEEIFGILGHVDVVPASADGWKYDPFEGEVCDGIIYGRGALDDKGPIIASLYAMKAAKETGYRFNKRVRLILGTNEETRWEGIKYYLNKEEEPNYSVVPDTDFPLINGEKGILHLKITKKLKEKNNEVLIEGGEVVNSVPKYCVAKIKRHNLNLNDIVKPKIFEFEEYDNYISIKANGKAAHGSTPENGDNAISKLLLYLNKLNIDNDEIYQFIKFYNKYIGLDYHGTNLGMDFEDEISGKLTMNIGKLIVDEHKIELEIDIRYPFCTNYEEVIDIINSSFTLKGYDVEESSHKKAIYIPKENDFVQRLMKIYRENMPDIESEPIVIGGGTYARALNNALAFGPLFPGVEDTCHQKDECIRIDNLIRFTEIYIKTIIEFAGEL